MEGVNLVVAGVTGAVGQEFLRVLEERNFPIRRLALLASPRSAGKIIPFRGKEYTVETLENFDPSGYDIALFSAGGGVSKAQAPRFADAGVVVVDNSSAFRMEPDVPLVIPEVNPESVNKRKRNIIANPNCSTIIALVPLWPLHRHFGLKRVVIATYQAVSGAGARALEELRRQTERVLRGEDARPEVFPHPIAFNLFSHNSEIDDEGFNLEERKMIRETHKIFEDETIGVCATCIRVPTFRSHAEAINTEFAEPVDLEEVRFLLGKAPGVRIVDDRASNHFPMPLEASDQDDILVGRIRRDPSAPRPENALAFFVAGDQLRKGAATNAVQIAELILQERSR
ncbi:MAG: aspartate-semialdehyde dehydrogenase [Candidatus Hydrogenedentota bacterium]|nr:MAG: aspartate-semialdehyde dehydrogenase [Candidatus Hydrogenedentota bacterium]